MLVFADCSVKILDVKFGNISIVSLYRRNLWRVFPPKFHHAFTVNHADSPEPTRMSHELGYLCHLLYNHFHYYLVIEFWYLLLLKAADLTLMFELYVPFLD